MRILQVIFFLTVLLAQPQVITKQIIKQVKQDAVVYNDSIDALTVGHYKGLFTAIDYYYKRVKPEQTYRYIPLSLFPYFCYRNELLPKDKPVIYFGAFRYNLMQVKLTPLGGELVAIATVSYVKMKNNRPRIMTYRLNFYEYSAITDDWKKSEYTTSIDFFLTKSGGYVNK